MTTKILVGDCRDTLSTLPAGSARCCVTSPPYFGLRDYGVDGQIGLESSVDAYVAELVAVFREVRRVLTDDGTLWLNLGDSYSSRGGGKAPGQYHHNTGQGQNRQDAGQSPRSGVPGFKPKDLVGVPWRVAFALQAPWLTCRGCGAEHHATAWATFPNGRRICPSCERSHGADVSEFGWCLRSDIIWSKPNPMPESVRDRPTRSHEYVFLLSKGPRYFYDQDAAREPAVQAGRVRADKVGGSKGDAVHHSPGGAFTGSSKRNVRSVWTITPKPFKGAHFATFPPELAERCIKAGSSERGRCPRCGAAWVRVVEKAALPASARATDTYTGQAYAHPQSAPRGPKSNFGPGSTGETVGWSPSCGCGLAPVPDAVLDPFGGAGTTALAATNLDRDAVLCELNPEYAEMARSRIVRAFGLFAGVTVRGLA